MPEIGEPEEWASLGSSEHAVPISATKQAIEALENDPELSFSKAAKIFRICRQTLKLLRCSDLSITFYACRRERSRRYGFSIIFLGIPTYSPRPLNVGP
jgi:hypothetical protein